MTHEDELLIHVFQMLADIDTMRYFLAPGGKQLVLHSSFSKQEDAGLRMKLQQFLNDLAGAVCGVAFARMSGSRCYAYPLLKVFLRANDGRQQIQVASLGWE